jgi:hypothetical protein
MWSRPTHGRLARRMADGGLRVTHPLRSPFRSPSTYSGTARRCCARRSSSRSLHACSDIWSLTLEDPDRQQPPSVVETHSIVVALPQISGCQATTGVVTLASWPCSGPLPWPQFHQPADNQSAAHVESADPAIVDDVMLRRERGHLRIPHRYLGESGCEG